MFIAPNTTIKILRNCPLDNSYDHTLYFASESAQVNYFSSLAKYNLTAYSYQRIVNSSGKMKVNYKAEDLFDCNYIMFQNSSFGTKWFYAFVTSVEFVNNVTSWVYFELDIMQTWFFDYDLDTCFVEREHSITDNVGDNLVTENVGYGDYITETQETSGALTNWKIVVAKATSAVGVLTVGGMYGNQYSQVEFIKFNTDAQGILAVKEYLDTISILSQENGCVDMFMMPNSMIPQLVNGEAALEPITVTKTKSSVVLGDYTPRNKKLLTYPYNFLEVDNTQGQTIDLHYEYFNSELCSFRVYYNVAINPSILLIPWNYNANVPSGSTSSGLQTDTILSINNLPKCPYATSDLPAKMMQATMGIAVGGAIGLGGMAKLNAQPIRPAGYYSQYNIPEPTTDFSNLQQTASLLGVSKLLSGLAKPISSNVTNANASSTLFANGLFEFIFRKKHIRTEFAKIIDDYFDRFGYATMRNKIPNTHSRPHWNYVKTQACTITGSIPCDDAKRICDLYDRGITFWKNGSEVGNYLLDNTPT